MSATVALVAQGRHVTMLDVGQRLEPANAALRARLSDTEPEEWQDSDIGAITGLRRSGAVTGILPFGSDFLFRDPIGLFAQNQPPENVGVRPSFAAGGFSNGWGASILPYRTEDLSDWPTVARELSPHYTAIGTFLPIAARPDALAELFPMLPVPRDTSLPMTSQAQALLRRLEASRRRLTTAGIYFGQARVAVSSAECRCCRMCLYGCPYGLIFNSSALLEGLYENDRFSYRPGHYVTRFEETSGQVRVFARNVNGDGEVEFTCDRLFVAGGVLPTARLVLNSIKRFDEPVLLKDSQHFYLPLLQSWWPRPDPADEAAHTLTQLFIEILDPSVDSHTVHVQLYTYNDLYAVDMRKRFGALARTLSPLIEHLSRRLIVAQAFLHSDSSSGIEVTLVKSGDDVALTLKEKHNPATPGAVNQVRKKLSTVSRKVGLLALSPFSRVGLTGSSFHCGGTFPMRDSPSGIESDTLGRPAGLRRVYLVDASVLPSIPATTITLSVMAIAHRIATQSAQAVT